MAAYYDLGAHTRPVSTTSPEAQTWFDRGLVWCYGFNHEEAIRCFERAVESDPGLAMAHWGIAYAIGPNYNKAWDAFEADELVDAVGLAYAEIATATSLAGDRHARGARAHRGAGAALPDVDARRRRRGVGHRLRRCDARGVPAVR